MAEGALQAGLAEAASRAALGGNVTPLLVHNRQKGNPVLQHVRNVRWQIARIAPDFVLGADACAVYISMRFHLLHPDYLVSRISEVKSRREFRLRVLLVEKDIDDTTSLPLLTSLAAANGFTVVLCWSKQEAARYLETYKLYERRSAYTIQERADAGYMPKLEDAMTTIRSVNKRDVQTLSNNFGSLREIMSASMEELALCEGIGNKKVKRIFQTFNEPF